MESIGVGLIGVGWMGKCHALAFNTVKTTFGEVPRPRLEILCDVDEEQIRAKASDWGFARWTTQWRDVISDPRVDVVAITTPNRLHREMAVEALETGRHVYCEKPMAMTLQDAEVMAETAHKSGRVTLLGYGFAKNPALVHAKRLIESGVIGKVFDFRGFIDEDYVADPELPWTWRLDKEASGLGVLGDLMCHLVSIAHLLLGRITGFCGLTQTVYETRPVAGEANKRKAVQNEDLAHAVVRFENGVAGVLASSRIAHGRKNGIHVEVHGSGGTLVFDQERMNELQLYVADEAKEAAGFKTILTGPQHPPYNFFCPVAGHSLGYNDLKVIEVAHLLRGIAGREKVFPNFEDGLAIEKVIHGFSRSVESGTWVSI